MHGMCGRYSLRHTPASLQQWYDVSSIPDFSPRFNIAPTTPILAVRATSSGRESRMMRWGLIPSWAKDPASLPLLFNARAETLTEKPMFRHAFKRRRCLIPASGFYEWKTVPGQKLKQPFYISFKDGTPMSLAGLWESAKTVDGAPLETCLIITTTANHLLEPIHHRMPVLLEHEEWELWLGAEAVESDQSDQPEHLRALLKPFDADRMQAWGVSHAVNRIANDDATLIEPIAVGTDR